MIPTRRMLHGQYPVGVGDDLVDSISCGLSRSGIYLSHAEIQQNVVELETYWEGYDGSDENLLMTRLKNKLAKDKELGGTQGLYRSRRQFYVFCHAARHNRSVDLAKALLRFLERNSEDIHDEEKDILVTEWCHGLLQLRSLVDNDKWHRVLQKVARCGPPMFEELRMPGERRSLVEDLTGLLPDRIFSDHGRGRHQLQHYDFSVQRLSVPARRPSLVDLPRYACTGHNSPLLSPMHSALDVLQEQQQRQQCEIRRLERSIDHLRHPW
ncbi:uncharacterized protein M421DRAFT_394810 [Didymella exigua CBS 183.55]|uniref:Uncharacterized protein n=1 Tax=Didymella exigua CBS 183.55 TaxID=1150837 RepID=A0A6A5RJ48_9PLEO|nr:uncharacterized protein M421DRAFT_394810 [Didymella exigua CBS 183.55]KAF1926994.1 hypothetical protein M421DRAFT_394810 [Didymella exigua CBS 183.55]